MNRHVGQKLLLLAAFGLNSVGCGGSGGACAGESSPGKGVCYDNWDQSDCDRNQEDEVNGADWTFHSGEQCEDIGYTYDCSDGYRDHPCP